MKYKWSKRSTIALLSLLLIGSAFALFPRKTSRSSKALSQMSPEEHYYLATFLRVILFSDDFSYLLFGSKPIAAAGFEKSIPFNFLYDYVSELNFKAMKGLEIFKKNQHLFSSGNIIVRFDEDAEDLFILMINRKNLLKTLEKHIDDFKRVLGPETTKESLFTQITEKDCLADVIKNHEALFGILLGYGRDNAWLFNEKKTVSRRLNRFEPPMKRDGSLEEEFTKIDQKTTFFSDDTHEWKYILQSPRIPLPHFMADPNSLETKKLREQYGKDREDMKRLFAKKNYVEATLEQLCDK